MIGGLALVSGKRREATLTQSVNVFTPSFQVIASPIYDTHKLDSFDDRNLSDSSQNSGFNPAYTLSDSLLVGGPGGHQHCR